MVNVASLKHKILYSFIFSNFGNCSKTFSDFNLQIYLLAFTRSLIFVSTTDTLIYMLQKLIPGFVWLYAQFSCPASPLNCRASSVFNGISLDIFLSLQISTSLNSSIYIYWSKHIQSCFCSTCKPRYLKFANSFWLFLRVFFSTLMTCISKFIVPPQKKSSTWQQINPSSLSSLCQ